MRRLSLTEWAAIAEIIAAAAVVVSLGFVSIEVRRNTRAVQAATLQSVNDIARQQILLAVTNPDVNRIYMMGDADLSKLTPEDRMRFFWQDRSFWLGMQTVFRQWELGVLPDDEWIVYNNVICNNIAGRGTRSLWPQEAPNLIPSFVKIVEACDTFRASPTGAAFQVPAK